MQIPILSHPELPENVPLVADFHDDRNRLSYYHPLVKEVVRTPITFFTPINGDYGSYPEIEYREVTRFMQEINATNLFVRSDYSSGKLNGEDGSRISSQDAYDIESVVLELLRQLSRTKRHMGGRIAFREWVPHDVEVRYFIREGNVLYRGSLDDVTGVEYPDEQAERVAETFDTFSWSVDFIRHETTEKWYCTDMGLDGLYHDGTQWVSISEHLNKTHSPQQHADDMPNPKRLMF